VKEQKTQSFGSTEFVRSAHALARFDTGGVVGEFERRAIHDFSEETHVRIVIVGVCACMCKNVITRNELEKMLHVKLSCFKPLLKAKVRALAVANPRKVYHVPEINGLL
jgi:hypothetical protein